MAVLDIPDGEAYLHSCDIMGFRSAMLHESDISKLQYVVYKQDSRSIVEIQVHPLMTR